MTTLATSRVLVVGGFALAAALLLARFLGHRAALCRIVYGRLPFMTGQ